MGINNSKQTNSSFGLIHSIDNPRPGYYKNKKGIYYGGNLIINNQTQISSFVKLGHGYGKTNSHVFYEGKIIENCSPFYFKLLPRNYLKKNNNTTNNHLLELNRNNVLGEEVTGKYYFKGLLIN